MTYSTLNLVTQRLRQSASVVFTSILGLVVMASLVSCGPLSPGQFGGLPGSSPEGVESEQPSTQASLLIRKFEWKYEKGISLPQYRLADDYLRGTAPAEMGVSPLLSTRYAQTEYMPILTKGDGTNLSSRQFADWGYIAFIGDFDEHVQILEGRHAKPAESGDHFIEAVMMTEKLDAIGANVGDNLILIYRLPGGDLEPIEVKIVGRWSPTDPNEVFWFYNPPYFNEGLLVPEATYIDVILPGWDNIGYEYTWYSVFDVEPSNIDAVNAGVGHIRTNLAAIIGEVEIHVLPPGILAEGEEQSTTQ